MKTSIRQIVQHPTATTIKHMVLFGLAGLIWGHHMVLKEDIGTPSQFLNSAAFHALVVTLVATFSAVVHNMAPTIPTTVYMQLPTVHVLPGATSPGPAGGATADILPGTTTAAPIVWGGMQVTSTPPNSAVN